MMVKMSKAEIISALRNETDYTSNAVMQLGGANYHWLHDSRTADEVMAAMGCRVCAVGAVLRSILDPNVPWEDYRSSISRIVMDGEGELEGNPQEQLDSGYYLAALSSKYEALARRDIVTEDVIEELIEWVKLCMPDSFWFEAPSDSKLKPGAAVEVMIDPVDDGS